MSITKNPSNKVTAGMTSHGTVGHTIELGEETYEINVMAGARSPCVNTKSHPCPGASEYVTGYH